MVIGTGIALLLASPAMAIIGAGIFTLPRNATSLENTVGIICFFGWWLPGLIGLTLLVVTIAGTPRATPRGFEIVPCDSKEHKRGFPVEVATTTGGGSGPPLPPGEGVTKRAEGERVTGEGG